MELDGLMSSPPVSKATRPGSRTSAMVFQALRHIGQEAVDTQAIARLRRALSPGQLRELVKDARYTTGWISAVVRQMAKDETEVARQG